MKKLLTLLPFIPILVFAQSPDQNWIKNKIYKQPTGTVIPIPTIEQANVQVTYFDGLGRPMQQIAHRQAANGKDIVTHIEYDPFGRQTKDFLPYTKTASLDYSSSANTDVVSFYNSRYQTNIAFSEKQLESSPLNRVFKQAAPGDTWGLPQTTGLSHDRSIKFDYQSNNSADLVKLFEVSTTAPTSPNEPYGISIVQNGHYAENQLYKTITKDENWILGVSGNNNTTQEFKNKQGQVVLKRTFNKKGTINEMLDTYYVYDQFGNLSYVIPPLAEGNPSVANLDKLCYQYKYDYRNRLVEKKLPGKQWEFIVYDKLDRPVATGPTYSPFGDSHLGWMITKYDVFGRVTYTGWYSGTVNEVSRNSLQGQLNNATVLFETKAANTTIDNVSIAYTNNAFPTSNLKILTINYYDNYIFPHSSLINTTIPGVTLATNVKGLPTGSWVRVLEGTTDTNAELSYTLYDDRYRPVRSHTQNYLGGYTQVDTSLDWAGKTLGTVTTHKRTANDSPLTITETFEYTQQDRLYKHKHQVNGEPEVTVTENSYDELGQLILKTTGDGLQDVDYRYNIRGWLTAINDEELAVAEDGFVNLGEGDLFAFKISYDNVLNPLGSTTALYNGNISETFWKTSTDNIERQYGYEYDNLNRLKKANFIKNPYLGGEEHEGYDEIIQYDKNGNIEGLIRYGKIFSYVQQIDELAYTYDGNKLMSVYDNTTSPQGFNDGNTSGDDYDYDPFGNMTEDKNKGIELIIYNHLNLPTQIQFANGNNIDYVYNAVGQKVSKSVKTGQEYAITDYLSGFQYRSSYTLNQGDQSEAVLKYFPMAEGYIQQVDERYFYIYHYTDHLGNIRLSYTYDENAAKIKIMEENHYYPFGLKHDSYNTQHLGYTTYTDEDEIKNYVLEEVPKFVGDGSYNYKYNGKELQDELGLNMYDYGARNYDPALGRWMNIDPLAEKYYSNTPYNYAGNIPTRFIDYDGKDFGIYIDHENHTIRLRANYYFDNENDYNNNSEALKSWNNLSGTYTTDDGIEYAISVELNGIIAKDGESASELASSDSENIGNYISEKNETDFKTSATVTFGQNKMKELYDRNIGGITSGGKNITNRSSVSNTQTRAHEIGHTLGFGENAGGVMNYSDSFSNMSMPTTDNLLNTLKVPYKHFKSKDDNSLNTPSWSKLGYKKTNKSYVLSVEGQYQGSTNFLDKGSIVIKSTN